MPNQVDPPEPTPEKIDDATLREHLGKLVREEWIAWAKEQPNPKPSWLVEWDGLSDPDKEVDRRIGERLFREGLRSMLSGSHPLTGEAYFIDRDLFTKYIAEKVNPARVAEGLARIPSHAAYVCYDVLHEGRHRR